MSGSLDAIIRGTKNFFGGEISPKKAVTELQALMKGGREGNLGFDYKAPVFLDFSIFDNYLSFLEKERGIYDSYRKLVENLETGKGGTPVTKEYKSLLREKLSEYDKGIKNVGRYKKTMERRLKYDYSVFLNSSIWFRAITKLGDDAEAIKKEFEYFNKLGLYDYSSAIEYFDFNCRINKNNYLKSSSVAGHGNFVTPILYGDELKSLEVLRKNCFPSSESITFEFFKEFHDVALRILVVDDKVGSCQSSSYLSISDADGQPSPIKIYDCKSCEVKCKETQCKLKTIRQLMDDAGKDEDIKALKQAIFSGIGEDKDYFYWNEKDIKCYFCPDVMKDFIDDENERKKLGNIVFKDIKFSKEEGENDNPEFVDFEKGKVQLIGVRDVRTALLLLSRYKFDMIFFDYLLDKKDENTEERDFSLQFFKFLSEKKEWGSEALKKLRRDVLDNRGPLDKLWIMPITGFNDTFIADLSRNGVPLISSKWHINNGADPITTPWQFLEKLNLFIELQLKGCLYKRDKLLQFLQYTGEDLKVHFREVLESKDKKMSFWEFQAFMGAEYSSFMSHYGSRLVIKRDAVTDDSDGNMTDKSVFATYIWYNFYRLKDIRDAKEKQNKKLLFGLHNQMTKFYQVAASMPDDHYGIERIREAFRRLRYYVDSNRLAESMEGALKNISDCIDKLEA